ncbi:MAG: MBL fold metallo-hydrolase [archaeon]
MPLLNPIKNVFLFKTAEFSCNSYLIKGKQNVLVDSGSASSIPEHVLMLKELNLKPLDIDFVFHTHGHYDHFEADKIYGNAKKFISKTEAELLENNRQEFTKSSFSFVPEFSFFSENQLLEFFPFALKVIFTPGHSKGSVCFFEEKKKWLFSGDTLFEKTIGRTDLPSSSFDELKNSIKLLSGLEISFLFPGHGKIISGIKENKENFNFINKNFF